MYTKTSFFSSIPSLITHSTSKALHFCSSLDMKCPPKGSCVESLVPVGGTIERWVDHQDSNLMDGLTHWWIHSCMDYCAVGPGRRKWSLECAFEEYIMSPDPSSPFSLCCPTPMIKTTCSLEVGVGRTASSNLCFVGVLLEPAHPEASRKAPTSH
jgi:hypothetical protein